MRLTLPIPFKLSSSSLSSPTSTISTTTSIIELQQHIINSNKPMNQLTKLFKEISIKWSSLTRSNLKVIDQILDPKMKSKSLKLFVNTKLKGDITLDLVRDELIRLNPIGELDGVEVLELPEDVNRELFDQHQHGSLYLPYSFVVPGGVFQEMYAWDSFFIVLGLIRDKEIRLAKNMLDNYIYQIEHYGMILNGNRTYYLNRSQLPFITQLIKLIYPTIPTKHSQSWLRRAIKASEKYHEYWTTGNHLVQETGLSRFFDSSPDGTSPPEIVHEVDRRDGKTAHERVRKFFRDHHQAGIPDYDILQYYDPINDKLTEKYMNNDRAMRESGFDTSSRFGMFNAKVLDFNPICLNSLLVQMEFEIHELYQLLHENLLKSLKPNHTEVTEEDINQMNLKKSMKKTEKKSKLWKFKSIERIKLIRKFNWDSDDGMFYDYDYVKGERRKYLFGTCFLPLWCGFASKLESELVVKHALKGLEAEGGLLVSNVDVGDQWDSPYGWAPLQLFGVEGMKKYGFEEEAERVALKFNSMVLKTWIRTGELWEKYDVKKCNEIVDLKFGYATNEVGFGWTNAVFTRFYDLLSNEGKKKLSEINEDIQQAEIKETIEETQVEKVKDENEILGNLIGRINELDPNRREELMKKLSINEVSLKTNLDSDEDWIEVGRENV
ncbi:family 37 glycoside hydrolase [Melampsora larici-populina 98AG31]|uniref:Trehalase n=1 Tax=Melampsora larici-populina (strain 98AG31 / pathotype 3-4-7) TaxID=747676 RepID=F4RIS5_MELLP|nr:family 37 glycoside hydrolase [Melampsora larici-populina 98AG31]EGG07612.1 family 37 glycoside hydrolase [Melampsora larici-populina 98AG31]